MFKLLSRWFGNGKKQEPKIETKQLNLTQAIRKKRVSSNRIGDLGEYKINIQLDQLPKDCKYLSDIMISNPKSRTGYSQIDHVVVTTYGIFVIETKNYSGEIKGSKHDKQWSVSNRFRMYNPLRQNYGHIKALESILSSYSGLRYISIISFTARARFSIDPSLRKIDSDELVIYDLELSEYVTRKMNRLKVALKEPVLSPNKVEEIYHAIQSKNITDPAIRTQHVEGAKASN